EDVAHRVGRLDVRGALADHNGELRLALKNGRRHIGQEHGVASLRPDPVGMHWACDRPNRQYDAVCSRPARQSISSMAVPMADIFVSYTSKDRDWAFWVGQELEALGHTPHIHEWEIAGGGDIAAWMEERHHQADHVLCVISEEYLAKPYSSWERRAAQWAAAK